MSGKTVILYFAEQIVSTEDAEIVEYRRASASMQLVLRLWDGRNAQVRISKVIGVHEILASDLSTIRMVDDVEVGDAVVTASITEHYGRDVAKLSLLEFIDGEGRVAMRVAVEPGASISVESVT